MEIAGLMNEIVERLQGRTAIVQIIVDGECHLRRVGDVNELIDHPELVAPSATESFLEWMATQIDVAAVCEATKGNHRNCLDHLRRFRPTMTFADVSYSLVSEFDAYLTLTVLATTPPTISSSSNQSPSGNIYVPASAVDTYKSASGWSTWSTKIVAIQE